MPASGIHFVFMIVSYLQPFALIYLKLPIVIWSAIQKDPFIGTRPNGTVATFTCMDGFILDGTTNTRICLNGGWTGTERVCLKGVALSLHEYMYVIIIA